MVARRAPVRYRLPLFPLPVVLFPDARMPLHIFEQRYRDMVRDVMGAEGRFGLVYHDWDEQGPFLSESGHVGCVAQIVEHEGLEDGRSLIVVKGLERFEIDDGIESEAPYYEALVRQYVDVGVDAPEPAGLAARRTASIELFEQLMGSLDERPEGLPDFESGGDVSFRLARSIHVDPRWRQELLEMRTEAKRLDRVDAVFRALLED